MFSNFGMARVASQKSNVYTFQLTSITNHIFYLTCSLNNIQTPKQIMQQYLALVAPSQMTPTSEWALAGTGKVKAVAVTSAADPRRH